MALDIMRRKAEYKLRGDTQLKEFRDREAKILWSTYAAIQTAVQAYCKANRVGLVLQFNSEPINQHSPSDVVKGVGRFIVYSDPARDITPAIMEMLNKQTAKAQASSTK
jgi:hypothetical protein